jgi:DNA topoisomerase VI subunit B
MPVKPLVRTAFTTSRVLEYFSEAELMRQIGYGRPLWPLVLVKELIDNGLDACEATDRAPEITVTLDNDAIAVADNGPGLKPAIIRKASASESCWRSGPRFPGTKR